MLNEQRALAIANTSIESQAQDSRNRDEEEEGEHGIRDIHALTPPRPTRGRRREAWETSSHRSSSLSVVSSSDGASPSENFSSMSREFSALVIAGSTIANNNNSNENDGVGGSSNLGRIGEEELPEETNPLAIVPDNGPFGIQEPHVASPNRFVVTGVSSVQRVKKEEVESKINAWQTAKIAKINNRFKREDAIINGWESEQVQKANSWMKKIERKLEEKRARALEKMQNDIAKARRKAEERRASAEGKRGTKVARVLEITNLMRAVGRAPVKRSFF